MANFDRAAFVIKEARDGLQYWVDAVKARRILASPCAVEETERSIADRDAELAEHGYS
jgi:hypothetical protein